MTCPECGIKKNPKSLEPYGMCGSCFQRHYLVMSPEEIHRPICHPWDRKLVNIDLECEANRKPDAVEAFATLRARVNGAWDGVNVTEYLRRERSDDDDR